MCVHGSRYEVPSETEPNRWKDRCEEARPFPAGSLVPRAERSQSGFGDLRVQKVN